MRWPPRIWYYAHPYISFQGAAGDYRRLLGAWAPLVSAPKEADIAILHHQVDVLGSLTDQLPCLARAYAVGYAVWETDHLPPGAARGLAGLDEIWTASAYCHQAFEAAHPRVRWLPHVVRPPPPASLPTAKERALLADLAAKLAGNFVYFSVYNVPQSRKNIAMLRRAFASLRRHLPNIKLLLKGRAWRVEGGLMHTGDGLEVREIEPDVLMVYDRMTAGGMEAMWRLADVLVSPHHSEGWGLSLSEAMVRGTATIASDFSGNRDFMTPHNSLLVAAPEGPIADADLHGNFTADMAWGNPMRASLEAQMRAAHRLAQAGELEKMAALGARDVACYGAYPVGRRLRRLVADIVRRVRRAGGVEGARAGLRRAGPRPEVSHPQA